jgi:hypothetical protein
MAATNTKTTTEPIARRRPIPSRIIIIIVVARVACLNVAPT